MVAKKKVVKKKVAKKKVSKKNINRSSKGSRLERLYMKQMTAAGYRCIRSSRSLGDWDCVCVGDDDIVFAQIKANRKPGKLEMRKLEKCRLPSGCSKEVVIYHDGHPNEPEIIRL